MDLPDSGDGHAANGFQAYVNGTLGFNQMRFGWMYGTCSEVRVHCVYEPWRNEFLFGRSIELINITSFPSSAKQAKKSSSKNVGYRVLIHTFLTPHTVL